MTRFIQHRGVIAPLDHANIDTDAIIPKQFLQKVTRSGFGRHLFHDWRFLDSHGNIPNPDFILNQPQYHNASILLTRENFGCGSSREHAPWALLDYGVKVILAPSFADIFYNNCFNNYLLPIQLQPYEIDALFTFTHQQKSVIATIDLEQQTVITPNNCYSFNIDPFRRYCLLNGLDSIGLTLQHLDRINIYEQQQLVFLR